MLGSRSHRKTPSSSYQKIWSMVEKIPRGKVATYGQIARLSRMPGHARLVGYALNHLPYGITVPWHRVINAAGKISFPENSPAYRRQKERLENEKVVFLKGRVDLKKYGWKK